MSGERLILTLLAQIALILALTRLLGWIFSLLRQPQIVGEVLAGILIGPSVLGWVAPQLHGRLFPQETMPVLSVLAQIAAIFLLFLIALKLDWTKAGNIAWAIALIAIPIAYRSLAVVPLLAIYLLGMTFLIRPLLKRLILIHKQRGKMGHNMLAAILLLLLVSSLATRWIGLGALMGAFLFALVLPREPKFLRHLTEKFQDLVFVLFLPIFVAFLGLNTDITLLGSARWRTIAILILVIAIAGTAGGVFWAARGSKISSSDSVTAGVRLNTYCLGLLLILTAAFGLQIISSPLFAILVLMTLAITAIPMPLLRRIHTTSPSTSQHAGGFSILIPVSLPKSGGPLVQIADALIGPARDSGKLLALHLRRPAEGESFDSSDQGEAQAAMAPLLAQAKARALPVDPITFVSDDIPADIAHTAANRGVNLVLMGYHNPIFGKAMLGGAVHRVLAHCPTDVAVFVDRGLRNIDRILVPYLGSAHDALALELAAHIVRNTTAQATILHVVAPMTPSAAKSAEAKRAVDKTFDTSSVSFQVVEDCSPVGVVLHHARDYDLVIIGVAEEWGLESRLFGWRPEKIARDSPASLLIVRRFAKADALPAPPQLHPTSTASPHIAT